MKLFRSTITATSSTAAPLLGLLVLCSTIIFVSADDDLCTSEETNTFTAVVDLHAGELGYFTFKECPGKVSPTLGLELGQTYTFIQEDISNWMHPLGFAYFPDGAHDDKDELEPGITQTGSDCAANSSCPTPLYYRDDRFLGLPGTYDTGLDVYEPEFFSSPVDWSSAGTYSIQLTFDDANYNKDIFYFCHIHQYMSGRIKILNGGVEVSPTDEPPLDYSYDQPGTFDEQCGTFGLDAFELPNKLCPARFVCNDDESNQALAQFSSCIDAMNCAMLSGMTTGTRAASSTALFIHQMIPHHQNAVNMAKALLKGNELNCDDLANEDNDDCIMEVILREIINTQNHQIQKMLGVLKNQQYPLTDNCNVEIETVRMTQDSGGDGRSSGPSSRNMFRALSASLFAATYLFCF